MRIALVHSFYGSAQPSGENAVVQAEYDALTRAGHEVELFAARTDDLEGDRLYPVRAGIRVATGYGANPGRSIGAFSPDVTRVHNTFPNMGTRWVRHLDGEVQVVLHNYRTVCANGLLFRDGDICTACPDGDRWAGVRHGCFRGSKAATLPVAIGAASGFARSPLVQRADRVICLSDLQREILGRYGLPEHKTEVWPNFLPDHLDPGPDLVPDDEREGWVFVGRLSPEKGILELLQHWPGGERLTVIGDGPLRAQVEAAAAGKQVDVRGALPRPEVIEALRSATGLVFPSPVYEASPLVYVESLASATPVVSVRPGAASRAVEVDSSGAALERLALLPDMLPAWNARRPSGERTRDVFRARYSERVFLNRFDSTRKAVSSSGRELAGS